MRTQPRVALVTTEQMPVGQADEELPLLTGHLSGTARVEVVDWKDPAVDWAGFDLAVIRSTWDYSGRLAEYLDWATRCADRTRLANPAEVVRWNSDKRYLSALHQAGVPVTPTSFLPPGAIPDLPDDREYVVKPTVGAGSWQVARYGPADRAAALAHIGALHAAGNGVLVQPFLSRVESEGERSLIYLDGQFRYAIRKGAVLVPGADPTIPRDAHPGVRLWPASAAERAAGDAALAAVPGGHRLLYARVDLINDDTGAPLVSELELIEPDLFLGWYPGSLDIFCTAIMQAASS